MSPAGAALVRGRIGVWPYAFVLVELALLAVVIRQFQIESHAFLELWALTAGAFAVHAWLPLTWRLPFFVAVSIGGIVMIFGVVSAAWLVGLGLVLIGLCHLPLAFRWRVVILLVVGAGLAALRVHPAHAPWSAAVWPILGSMFMFRLIVYLYDLKHDTTPVSPWRTLGYFFLLPNVCFPLFPVVDFKTFRRTYYDDDAFRLYQVGVDWIVRGVVHLVLYRYVYYYLTMAPSEILTPRDLAQFVVSTFLLYLRVSGQFHIIVGILYLFGFHLPETHHKYFFASSFTDFWRRINIYWKDFMLKVFYYPAYFALKSWGTTRALVAATLFVFFATWLLHAYQWFWLRGTYLLTAPDGLFWAVLAVLVVGNSLYEMKHGRTRSLRGATESPGVRAGLALRTAGTFCTIALLWSFWNAESLGAWLSMWSVVGDRLKAHAGVLGGFVVLASVTGTTIGPATAAARKGRAPATVAVWKRPGVVTAVLLVALTLAGVPQVYQRLGASTANVILSLRSGQLSRVDNGLMERGYYEDLMRVDRFNSQLWEVYMQRPADWLAVESSTLERFTNDFLQKTLVSSFASTTRYGTIRTNRWGMRDREYEALPAAGTHRVTLLGASTVMGWGVSDQETFENLVETRLNAERAGQPWPRYEILNFSVPGYRPLQQLWLLERALEFKPQAVFYVANRNEGSSTASYLAEAVHKRLPLPWPYLDDVVRRANIDARTEESLALRRLTPFRGEMVDWVYRQIVERSRAHGAVPVLVYLPWLDEDPKLADAADVKRRAAAAGFVVLDLTGAFDGHDSTTLRLAAWDTHPNVRGHELIARRLYGELQDHAREIYETPTMRAGR